MYGLSLIIIVAGIFLPQISAIPDYIPAQDRRPGSPDGDWFIVKLKNTENLEGFLQPGPGDNLPEWRQTSTIRHQLGVINGFSGQLSPGAVRQLQRMDGVKYIEEDGVVHVVDPDPTGATDLWGLDRVDQRGSERDYFANFLGDYGQNGGGENVHIYIIDTGVRGTHEQFMNWDNTATRFSNEGVDFVLDDVDGTILDNTDCDGHGTHCAGTAAGKTYGVAKNATIHAVRVLDCYGSGYWSDIIAGMDWVAENHRQPAVASMSLGVGASAAVNDAANGVYDSGVLLVCSAGNNNGYDSCLRSPAGAVTSVAVGATDLTDTRSDFSNTGRCVTLFAPGSDILSSVADSNTASDVYSGTSMATPHVAGAVAVLMAIDGITGDPGEALKRLLGNSTRYAIRNVGVDSPNKLLFIGHPYTTTICPDATWDEFEGSCYHFVAETKSWTNAASHCNSMSGAADNSAHLISIDSVWENNVAIEMRRVEEINRNDPSTKIWIGLKDIASGRARSWTWDDGSEFVYNNWGKGEPNKRGGDCVAVEKTTKRTSTVAWKTNVCSQSLAFICEYHPSA